MAPLLRRPSRNLPGAEEDAWAVAAGVRRESSVMSPEGWRGESISSRSFTSGHQSAPRPSPYPGGLTMVSAAGEQDREGLSSPAQSSPSSLPPSTPLSQKEMDLSLKQRWQERCFLFSYVVDAIVCAVYDQVLPVQREGSKTPVVLVPGWCGRTRSFRKMAERLAREGHPVYPLPLGCQLGCIDRKSWLLSKFLDEHELSDVYVVAHSMGGLISVRSMMKGENRIRRLVTMGTPYRGTHVIYLGYAVTILLVLALSFWLSPLAGSIYLGLFMQIPSLWQMQPTSAFLAEVREYLEKVTTPVQCVYALRDQIVVHNWRQAWSPTRLGRDDDLCLPEYGHMNLFMGDSGVELVARLLSRYEEAACATTQSSPPQRLGNGVGGAVASPCLVEAKR